MMYQMTKMNVHTLDALSPNNEPIDIRLRSSADMNSSPNYRPPPPPRPIPLPLPDPLTMSQRPPLDMDHPEAVEPLRISFHEDDRDLRGSRHSLARSCKSGHEECILPPGPFERPVTAPLERLERDLEEDPYPSLAHVRTSASGLLRFPDSEGPDGEECDRVMLARSEENHSQCRLLPSPYPYWGDEEEDLPSPTQKDPFTG